VIYSGLQTIYYTDLVHQVMMVSAAACSMCWIVIAIALGLSANGGDSYKLGIVAVSFFFVFFASFGMGVLGVPWLYPTE
jgi:hypothetical protein